MDIYIEVLEQLMGLIRKHTQISDFFLWKDTGEGIRGVLNPQSIERNIEGIPDRFGQNFYVNLRIIGPIKAWKYVFQKMGIMQDKLTNLCHDNVDQKVRLKVIVGDWSRIEDDTNIIYENALTIKVVRLNA